MLRSGQRLLVSAVEDPLQRDETLEPGDADEEPKPVPGEHLADLAVTAGRRLRGDVSQPIKHTRYAMHR